VAVHSAELQLHVDQRSSPDCVPDLPDLLLCRLALRRMAFDGLGRHPRARGHDIGDKCSGAHRDQETVIATARLLGPAISALQELKLACSRWFEAVVEFNPKEH